MSKQETADPKLDSTMHQKLQRLWDISGDVTIYGSVLGFINKRLELEEQESCFLHWSISLDLMIFAAFCQTKLNPG